MDMTLSFYPFGVRNPFIRELKSHENSTLVFDGYFYVDQKDLPIQRVMVKFGEEVIDENGCSCRSAIESSHIEIYEKLSGEDTSYYGDHIDTVADISGNDASDDDYYEGNICLFPTEITTLKYRVMKSDLTDLEMNIVIKENEKARRDKEVGALMAGLSESE
jgi:hypothetical protein